MKQESTKFLRFVIYLLGIGGAIVCIIAMPVTTQTGSTNNYHPLLFGLYATAIPFFITLYKGLVLLGYIDQNKAFSQDSVVALRHIKYSIFTISLLYALSLPFLYFKNGQAGISVRFLLGLVLTLAPLVVTAFAAVLEKLFENALEIKSENDLTV